MYESFFATQPIVFSGMAAYDLGLSSRAFAGDVNSDGITERYD